MDIPSSPVSSVDLVESQVVLDCLVYLHDNRRLENNARDYRFSGNHQARGKHTQWKLLCAFVCDD